MYLKQIAFYFLSFVVGVHVYIPSLVCNSFRLLDQVKNLFSWMIYSIFLMTRCRVLFSTPLFIESSWNPILVNMFCLAPQLLVTSLCANMVLTPPYCDSVFNPTLDPTYISLTCISSTLPLKCQNIEMLEQRDVGT